MPGTRVKVINIQKIGRCTSYVGAKPLEPTIVRKGFPTKVELASLQNKTIHTRQRKAKLFILSAPAYLRQPQY